MCSNKSSSKAMFWWMIGLPEIFRRGKGRERGGTLNITKLPDDCDFQILVYQGQHTSPLPNLKSGSFRAAGLNGIPLSDHRQTAVQGLGICSFGAFWCQELWYYDLSLGRGFDADSIQIGRCHRRMCQTPPSTKWLSVFEIWLFWLWYLDRSS